MSLVDLFKRPSDDGADLPQPLSDQDLLAWSADLATIRETDEFTLLEPHHRRTPLKAGTAAAHPRRTRPLVADPL